MISSGGVGGGSCLVSSSFGAGNSFRRVEKRRIRERGRKVRISATHTHSDRDHSMHATITTLQIIVDTVALPCNQRRIAETE